jgi:hypothetical protein
LNKGRNPKVPEAALIIGGYRPSYIQDRRQYRKYNPVLDISTRDPTKARRKAIWSLVVTVERIPRTVVFLTTGEHATWGEEDDGRCRGVKEGPP